ncbi:hypothetical protein [Mycobacterium sp. URHB0044]|uniref:hypothetical protein n=1 Tax=Mycobacterium sp. URHB0044 TaxID=1380386 RepID=UPI0004920827|nr:hypothetical protein [Mycobacterium sp. URHB0044]
MTAFRKRIQTGTAACAIAAAAVLTPSVVANAEPAAPIPMAGLGSSVCVDPTDPAVCTTAVSPFASSAASLVLGPPPNILQNGLWWFGTPNPTPPTQTTVFTFYPLALVPGFLQPFFGWFKAINFELCIGGLTLQIGPYGTVSGSYSRGCA